MASHASLGQPGRWPCAGIPRNPGRVNWSSFKKWSVASVFSMFLQSFFNVFWCFLYFFEGCLQIFQQMQQPLMKLLRHPAFYHLISFWLIVGMYNRLPRHRPTDPSPGKVKPSSSVRRHSRRSSPLSTSDDPHHIPMQLPLAASHGPERKRLLTCQVLGQVINPGVLEAEVRPSPQELIKQVKQAYMGCPFSSSTVL